MSRSASYRPLHKNFVNKPFIRAGHFFRKSLCRAAYTASHRNACASGRPGLCVGDIESSAGAATMAAFYEEVFQTACCQQ
jgi:hypothetical protein